MGVANRPSQRTGTSSESPTVEDTLCVSLAVRWHSGSRAAGKPRQHDPPEEMPGGERRIRAGRATPHRSGTMRQRPCLSPGGGVTPCTKSTSAHRRKRLHDGVARPLPVPPTATIRIDGRIDERVREAIRPGRDGDAAPGSMAGRRRRRTRASMKTSSLCPTRTSTHAGPEHAHGRDARRGRAPRSAGAQAPAASDQHCPGGDISACRQHAVAGGRRPTARRRRST